MRLGIARHLGWAVAVTAANHEVEPLDDAALAALVADVRASAALDHDTRAVGPRWPPHARMASMLLGGINHVGMLTGDTDRLTAFYREVFEAEAETRERGDGFRLTMIHVGPNAELNVFELDGNEEHLRQVPMFGRGRLDHLALHAASIDAFDVIRDRLIERGATDGFVTDFGPILSLFFRDPDGMEAEVCVPNPDAMAGVNNPPGTPSRRYHDPDPE